MPTDLTFYMRNGAEFTVRVDDYKLTTASNTIEQLTWTNAHNDGAGLVYVDLSEIIGIVRNVAQEPQP